MALDALRSASPDPVEVEVPGWTQQVFIRQLPAWDLVRIADEYPGENDERARQFALIEATLVFADGEPVLEPGEARKLNEPEFSAITTAMRGEDDPGN